MNNFALPIWGYMTHNSGYTCTKPDFLAANLIDFNWVSLTCSQMNEGWHTIETKTFNWGFLLTLFVHNGSDSHSIYIYNYNYCQWPFDSKDVEGCRFVHYTIYGKIRGQRCQISAWIQGKTCNAGCYITISLLKSGIIKCHPFSGGSNNANVW